MEPNRSRRQIIGRSPAIQRLLRQIAIVGPTDATVLILGERGTGKELVADALPRASRRRDKPYVKVNCAALPAELVASELFGHERGAFTGALERRHGLLAAAGEGTLFLDEVETCRSPPRRCYCGFLGDARSGHWDQRRRSAWTCASLRQRTGI